MFIAASSLYVSTKQLMHKQISEYPSTWVFGNMPVFQDIYGRRVIHMRERFPCFDVYDRMCENRYYHWYFIAHRDGVTVVYTADDNSVFEVHENITADDWHYCHLTDWHIRELKQGGFLA